MAKFFLLKVFSWGSIFFHYPPMKNRIKLIYGKTRNFFEVKLGQFVNVKRFFRSLSASTHRSASDFYLDQTFMKSLLKYSHICKTNRKEIQKKVIL